MATGTVAITGNTYPVKDRLKALGGRWNADAKAWMIPADHAAEAQRLVGASQTNRARFIRPAEIKRCWECGCRFTYADAKRNGGEWRDSYCGC